MSWTPLHSTRQPQIHTKWQVGADFCHIRISTRFQGEIPLGSTPKKPWPKLLSSPFREFTKLLSSPFREFTILTPPHHIIPNPPDDQLQSNPNNNCSELGTYDVIADFVYDTYKLVRHFHLPVPAKTSVGLPPQQQHQTNKSKSKRKLLEY